MGYPDDFRIPVSDTQAYRQFGNSVCVPVIAEIARLMKPYIMQIKASNDDVVMHKDSLQNIAEAKEQAVAHARE